MSKQIYHVLFLCTGNSARSIIAEAVLNRLGKDRFQAFSAGSRPNGTVHPMAIEVLRERGHETDGLHSKSWQEFGEPGSLELDFVFTVCDNAAGEACPIWPGQPITAQWGMVDPAAFVGTEDQRRWRFRRTCVDLERRIDIFTNLRIEALDSVSLQSRVNEIGKTSTQSG